MQVNLFVICLIGWIIPSLWILDVVGATKCEHCHKDFVCLGRHVWRCPARSVTSTPTQADSQQPTVEQLNEPVASATDHTGGLARVSNDVVCICGRVCKGRRGFMSHRRSCKTAHRLEGEHVTADLMNSSAIVEGFNDAV